MNNGDCISSVVVKALATSHDIMVNYLTIRNAERRVRTIQWYNDAMELVIMQMVTEGDKRQG